MPRYRKKKRTRFYIKKTKAPIEGNGLQETTRPYNTRKPNVLTEPSKSFLNIKSSTITNSNSIDDFPTTFNSPFMESPDNTNCKQEPWRNWSSSCAQNKSNILLNAFRNDFSSKIPESQQLPLSLCNTSQSVIKIGDMSTNDDDIVDSNDLSLTVNDKIFEDDNYFNQEIPLHEEIAALSSSWDYDLHQENMYEIDAEESDELHSMPKCMLDTSSDPNMNSNSVYMRPEQLSLKQRVALKPNTNDLNLVINELGQEYCEIRDKINEVEQAVKNTSNPTSKLILHNFVGEMVTPLITKGQEIDHFNTILHDLHTDQNLRKSVRFEYNPTDAS